MLTSLRDTSPSTGLELAAQVELNLGIGDRPSPRPMWYDVNDSSATCVEFGLPDTT